MTPPDDVDPATLAGKRVTFKCGEDHAECWHCRMGLVGGVVRRPARTLAQKAEWVREEGGEVPEDWQDEYEDVPRVWVKADSCERFPSGCEAVVDVACLIVGA
jgi:hypothetical protein